MTSADGCIGNLALRFEHRSDRPALVLDDRTVTHEQLARRVSRWRGGLAAAGIRPRYRVAIVAGNDDLFVTAHLAVLGLGAVSVPINPQNPPAELARDLEAIDVDAVVAAPGLDPLVGAGLDLLGPLGVEPIRVDPAAADRAAERPVVDVDPDHPAVLLFTSGTAGPPRPALLTHGNLEAALRSILSLPTDLVGQPQVLLGVVPLFHVLGLNTVLHLGLVLGGSIVLGQYRGGPATLESIERHRVTVALGPPTLWQALSRAPGADPSKVASVRLALSGAAELGSTVRLAVNEGLGLHLDQGYGLTESAAVVASTVGVPAPPGSCGRLMAGVEARIVDLAGHDSLVGDPGQLLVRGPMVFPGYWTPDGIDRRPIDADGWLRTGDVAMVDDAGDLTIVGRSKDLVIVSGFNVFPGEVETVLLDHPDVAEAGVVGEPSSETGEAVVAFVVPVAGRSIDEEELIEHCRSELARYKVPSRLVVATDLPIGSTGKLQRNRLR